MIIDYKEARYVSTKRFTYKGEAIEPGQYLNARNATNDRLIFNADSRYVTAAPDARDREEWKCDRCGRYFLGEDHLRGHQRHLYAVENMDPEHVAELKAQSAKRIGRELKNETLADLAMRDGHKVEVNAAGVPMIQRR